MGLLKNVVNKFRQAKKAADEATTDHVANAEVGIDEGKSQLSGIERQLHELRTMAKMNEGKCEESQSKLKKIKKLIERQASVAQGETGAKLERAKENLAVLIDQRRQAEADVVDTKSIVDQNQVSIQQVTSARDEIKGQLRRAESRLSTQKAKLAAAKTTNSIRSSVTTYKKSGMLADIAALDDKVKHEEAKAEVAKEMTGEQDETTLASIEAQLDTGPSVDDEVASLLSSSKASKK